MDTVFLDERLRWGVLPKEGGDHEVIVGFGSCPTVEGHLTGSTNGSSTPHGRAEAAASIHRVMNVLLLTEHASSVNPTGQNQVTRGQLRERAVELAGLHGRAPQEAGGDDWEQAKNELIWEPEASAPLPSDSYVDLEAQNPGSGM